MRARSSRSMSWLKLAHWPSVALLLGLGMVAVCVVPGPTAEARSASRAIFGPALSWPGAQSGRSVSTARRFCAGLGVTPTALSRAQRRLPVVPEHPGLRWGLPVAKVRWVLRRRRAPVRLRCFAKTGNAYLIQRRRVSGFVRGGPRTVWEATLYFRTRAPYGLFDILLQASCVRSARAADAVVKAAKALYGPAKPRAGYRSALYRTTVFTWTHGKTRIRLDRTRDVRRRCFNLALRYSAR